MAADESSSWQSSGSPTQPDLANRSVIATPITNYGVVLFVACQPTDCHAYLYKHALNPA